jgi:hypothetical protein
MAYDMYWPCTVVEAVLLSFNLDVGIFKGISASAHSDPINIHGPAEKGRCG